MGATNSLRGSVKERAGSGALPKAFEASEEQTAARLAAAVTLAATLALATGAGVFSAALLVRPHTETLETLWWLAAFGVLTPLAALGARYLLIRTSSPAGARALAAAAPCALLALCASLALVRLAGDGSSLRATLLLVLAGPLALLATPTRTLARLAERPDARRLAALAVAAAGVLGVAAFLPADAFDPSVLLLSLLVVCVAVVAGVPLRGRSLHPSARLALGVLIPLLLALLAWDVSFQTLPSHQNFYLGPANDIRHGRYMLVDDYSQYGVVVIYFLTALLAPLSFGYGTFVLVLGLLTALLITTVYVVLRVATRSLAFAALGTLAALLASSIATLARSTQFPSTGFLRFGIPWLLICALVLAYRRERPARIPLIAAYALVGLSAVWSFETAFYTVATFVVTAVALACSRPDGERLRTALTHLLAGAGAALIAIAALVAATEAGRGRAPSIGGYVDFLRLYSVAGFGQLPVPGWSLGFLMGALYVFSLTAVCAIVLRGRGSELARASTLVPLVAVSTFGAVSLTYFLGRSHPNNLTNIAPPFVVMITLWTALAWRGWVRDRAPVAAVGVALAGACAALLVAQQVPQLVDKAPDSALAAVVGSATGGTGIVQRVRALTDLPVVSPSTRTVEALVRANVPRRAPLLVAVEPAIATETLIRLDRSDVLPIGTPEQDGLSVPRRALLLRQALAIPCGTYVVTQDAGMTGPGRVLLTDLVSSLRQRHPFIAVAAGGGYRVFRLGCARA